MMRGVCIADLHLEQMRDLPPVWESLNKCVTRHADLWILGDLFHSPHPDPELFHATLQRLVLFHTETGRHVHILVGNHDVVRGTRSSYLSAFGEVDGIEVYTEPTLISESGGRGDDARIQYLILPWTPDAKVDIAELLGDQPDSLGKDCPVFVLGHVHLRGALDSHGLVLNGGRELEIPNLVGGLLGDIHMPQKVGLFEYVGSARSVTFAQLHKPRCAILEGIRYRFVILEYASRSYVVRINSQDDVDRLVAERRQLGKNKWEFTRYKFVRTNADVDMTPLRNMAGEAREFVLVEDVPLDYEFAREQVAQDRPDLKEFVGQEAPKHLRGACLRVGKRIFEQGE